MEQVKIEINGVDVKSLLQRLEKIETALSSLSQPNFSQQTETTLLTRKEVAKLLDISLVTLHDWTKKGIVNAYRIGNLVRYKEAEVMDSLTKNQLYPITKK